MNSATIRSKIDMYHRLTRGDFGNTNHGFLSVEKWQGWERLDEFPLWGLRSLSPNDRTCRLDVPTQQVPEVVDRFQYGCQISPMIDPWTFFRGEVWESPEGLRVFGVFGHMEVKWREALCQYGQEWTLLGAKAVLDTIMWPGDREDVRELLDLYPRYVIEFNCCTKAVGTLPRRNCVIWEVRPSDGSYERWA